MGARQGCTSHPTTNEILRGWRRVQHVGTTWTRVGQAVGNLPLRYRHRPPGAHLGLVKQPPLRRRHRLRAPAASGRSASLAARRACSGQQQGGSSTSGRPVSDLNQAHGAGSRWLCGAVHCWTVYMSQQSAPASWPQAGSCGEPRQAACGSTWGRDLIARAGALDTPRHI